MTAELANAEKLIKILVKKPIVYIDHIYEENLYSKEYNNIEKIEFKEFGYIRYNPSRIEIQKAFTNFHREVTVNKYKLLRFVEYIEKCYLNIKPIYEEFDHIILIDHEPFQYRKSITLYFNNEPDPIEDYTFFPHETLKQIQDYCQFQKGIINKILKYLNEQIAKDLDIESIVEQTKDENDTRIYIKQGSEIVKNYFSFFVKKTNTEEQILSDIDFEYFLNKNFQGFPKVSIKKELTFHLIDGNHLQFIVYNFYRKYSSVKEYPRIKWAELLKNTFPSKYGSEPEILETNFKKDKNNSTQNKFEELGLELPT